MKLWSGTEDFRRKSMLLGPVFLGFLILLSPWLGEIPRQARMIPFLVSLVFLGLPHGAMDHLVPSRLSEISMKRGALDVSLLYLFLGGLYGLVWFMFPVASLAAFVIITWLHWGDGDVYAVKKLWPGDVYTDRFTVAASGLLRGGIPMLIPLVAYPDLYVGFLESVQSLFMSSAGGFSVLYSESLRLAVLVLVVTLALIHFLYIYVASGRIPAYRISEISVLVVFFLVLPPVFAVGIYFCLWHSVRHLCRLSLLPGSSRQALEKGEHRAYLYSILRDTAPLTAVSILLLTFVTFSLQGIDLQGFVALYLVFISVLTLPHTALVLWMDKSQYG
jgi:Brp/Blh family beta-carotene 15,15'-monooxygenase